MAACEAIACRDVCMSLVWKMSLNSTAAAAILRSATPKYFPNHSDCQAVQYVRRTVYCIQLHRCARVCLHCCQARLRMVCTEGWTGLGAQARVENQQGRSRMSIPWLRSLFPSELHRSAALAKQLAHRAGQGRAGENNRPQRPR